MKKIITAFIALFTVLLLANCTSQMPNTENVKREWMLVEFQNFTKEMMTTNKANLNLSKWSPTDQKFSAKMGCNSMFGSAKIMGNRMVKFSEVASTMMFCDKNMDLETAFAKALPMMTNYKIEGHFLILSDNSGNSMKFVASDWD